MNLLIPTVASRELSERSDSSSRTLPRRSPSARPASLIGRAEGVVKADLMGGDAELVEEAAAWIRGKVAETLKRGAEEIGGYLLDRFFHGDVEVVKSRNPHKNASFRALVEKCGTSDLPVSKTWLNNAVGIATMVRQLPQTATAFKQLPPSFQETLLPLGDPTKVEKVARQAVTKELSFRDLRDVVAEERAKIPKDDSKGRPRTPVIVKTLNRSLRVLTLEGGKRSFTKADVEELDEEQKKNARESVEFLMEKLKDLVAKLKKA